MDTEAQTKQAFELWTLLHEAYDTASRVRDNELRQAGISRIQSAVLFTVKTGILPATPTALSRCLIRKPHAVSKLLDRMEKQGLIKKVRDLERKNMVRVVLTEKGKDAYHRAMENRKATNRVMSCLSQKERDNLRTYLERLRDSALEELGVSYEFPFP